MWRSLKMIFAGLTCVLCQGDYPSPIHFRAAYVPDDRIILVTWEDSPGFPSSYYQLEINETRNGNPFIINKWSETTVYTFFEFNVIFQLDGSSYFFQLQGKTSTATSSLTKRINVDILSLSFQPTNPRVLYTNNRSMKVVWSAKFSDELTRYVVLFRNITSLVQKYTVSFPQMSLVPRNISFEYEYRIHIYEIIGHINMSGPLSDEILFIPVKQIFYFIDGDQGNVTFEVPVIVRCNDWRLYWHLLLIKPPPIMFSPSGHIVRCKMRNSDKLQVQRIEYHNVTTRIAGSLTFKPVRDSLKAFQILQVVLVKPKTPSISQTREAVQGSPVTLICHAESASKPDNYDFTLSYHWHIKGGNISKYSMDGNKLHMQSLDAGDRENIYSCVLTVENRLSSEAGYHSLNLLYGPQSVTIIPNMHIKVTEGSSIGPIYCTSDCNPSCNIQWERKSTINMNFTRVSQNGILYIPRAKKQDVGVYKCVAMANSSIPAYLRERSNEITVSVMSGGHTFVYYWVAAATITCLGSILVSMTVVIICKTKCGNKNAKTVPVATNNVAVQASPAQFAINPGNYVAFCTAKACNHPKQGNTVPVPDSQLDDDTAHLITSAF